QDDLDLLTGRSIGTPFTFTDSIRVLALEPAVAYNDIEFNLARYDAVWRNILALNTQDQPLVSGQAFRNGNTVLAGTKLEKALPTGGVADITFGSDPLQGLGAAPFYSSFAQRNVLTGTLAQQYTPNLVFGFSQPLLRDFGTDINALLPVHPSGR